MLRQDTSAKGVVRRFIASAAASVQSRKKVRLLGRAPSEAEISHGKILTARFSSPIGVGSGTGDDNHSRIRQLTEINNVWTAEANVKLCPGCPDADPVLIDIFSLPELAKGEVYYAPAQSSDGKHSFKCSDPNGWANLKALIQQEGYQGGSQLTTGRSPSERNLSYTLHCYRHRHRQPKSPIDAGASSSEPFAAYSKPKSLRRTHRAGGNSTEGGGSKKNRPLNSTGQTKKGPEPGTKQHSSTALPQTPEDECPAVITIFIDKEQDRFYFKTGIGCNVHCKHPRLLPHEITALQTSAPEKVTSTQHDLARVHGPASVSHRMAAEQSGGVQYSQSAVRKWREEAFSNINNSKYGKVAEVNDDGTNDFVDMLVADPKVSALFLYDDIGLGVGPKPKGFIDRHHPSPPLLRRHRFSVASSVAAVPEDESQYTYHLCPLGRSACAADQGNPLQRSAREGMWRGTSCYLVECSPRITRRGTSKRGTAATVVIAHSDKEGVTDHCRCRREKDTVRALSVRADEIFCKKNLLSLLVLNDAYREGGTVTPAGRNWRRRGGRQ